jgi:hypothetical protein
MVLTEAVLGRQTDCINIRYRKAPGIYTPLIGRFNEINANRYRYIGKTHIAPARLLDTGVGFQVKAAQSRWTEVCDWCRQVREEFG